MNSYELKEYLCDNPNLIITILEELGMKGIRVNSRRISFGFPDSSRNDSVTLYLSNNLAIKTWSRSTEIKDFYDLVMDTLGIGFQEMLGYIGSIIGLNVGGKIRNIDKLKFKKERPVLEYSRVKSKPISPLTCEMFIYEECKLFTDDGINKVTQELFGVAYDTVFSRVVFPILGYNGELLSWKGRTTNEDYKELGIPKYLYYYPIDGRRYLYGYYENIEHIKNSEYVYIFESNKSVMQCASFDVRNVLALDGKSISFEQAEEIKLLGKKVVLCLDKDVQLDEIYRQCRKLEGLEVYYTFDAYNMLNKKDSPSDNGKEAFDKLIENKIEFKG